MNQTDFARTLVIMVWALLAAGCTIKTPLVSHAHVGHAMTAWHDAPDQAGLLPVALAELEVAWSEANLACGESPRQSRARHVENALHALVPELQARGSGSGYGALRAFRGAVEHLEYAATSPDASLNLIASVVALSGLAEPVEAHLVAAVELSRATLAAKDLGFRPLCVQMRDELHAALAGSERQSGMRGFMTELEAALNREDDPAYTPVAKRYVLGLVRLPGGDWGFRLPRQAHAHGVGGYSGY